MKNKINQCWCGCGKIGSSLTGAAETVNQFNLLENEWTLLTKLRIEFPYDSENLLVGIYPRVANSSQKRHLLTVTTMTRQDVS